MRDGARDNRDASVAGMRTCIDKAGAEKAASFVHAFVGGTGEHARSPPGPNEDLDSQ